MTPSTHEFLSPIVPSRLTGARRRFSAAPMPSFAWAGNPCPARAFLHSPPLYGRTHNDRYCN